MDGGNISSEVHINCLAQLVDATENSATHLIQKFVQAVDDIELMKRQLIAANTKGGTRSPVLAADMCCCTTPDWQALGRSSPWAGYHDCDAERIIELYYGNASLDNANGAFDDTRTRDVDLAWLGAASNTLPWIVDRQVQGFDRDCFYAAAWICTAGEVVAYYPGFSKSWPGHYLGDAVGGGFTFRDAVYVAGALPARNPQRLTIWTAPYHDPAGAGNMISVSAPIYFDGEFYGHDFQDEYFGTLGIDIVLHSIDTAVPISQALPMLLDDAGHVISAPPRVLEAIFGAGATWDVLSACASQGQSTTGLAEPQPEPQLEPETQRPDCSVAGSAFGNWSAFLEALRAAPRGQSGLGPDVSLWTSQAGGGLPDVARATPHLAAFHRWPAGRGAPLWNSVALLPRSAPEDSVRYTLPARLGASVEEARGAASLDFALENTGAVALACRLLRLPDWVTVAAPGPQAAGLAGRVVLPVGARLEYSIVLHASGLSGGLHTASLLWEVQSDEDVRCPLARDVVLDVSFNIPIPGTDTWVISAWVLGAGACLLCMVLLVRHVYGRFLQLQRLKKERMFLDDEQLETADMAASTMAFPIHLLGLGDFLCLGRLIQHEVLRDTGRLKVFDSVQDLANVKYFFLSHEWTGWGEPDHSQEHFSHMCHSVRSLAAQLGWASEDCYAWVDFSCVPQRHPRLQHLAILSLPVYASQATVFVIVAPSVRHLDTGEELSLSSYMTRTWCRSEQLSYAASRGIAQMYQVTDAGVWPVDHGSITAALHVFQGCLTCCRQQHHKRIQCDREHLVLPMLGLYAKLIRMAMETGVKDPILAMIEADEDIIFPPYFEFETAKAVERRILFGDLVGKMKFRVARVAPDHISRASLLDVRPPSQVASEEVEREAELAELEGGTGLHPNVAGFCVAIHSL